MSTPRVFRSLAEVHAAGPRQAAVTLGVFDGVHNGHRQIVEELLRSRTHGPAEGCYLVTFDPHPLLVTHSRMTPPILTTIDERISLLAPFGLDGILVLPFDRELANVDYRTFLAKYLRQAFDMCRLVLGYDCYFGRNREGNPHNAKVEGRRLGFDVVVVPEQRVGDEVVSSTKIRNALIEGDLERANRLLGHPYVITGTVVTGHGKGRELGFPTANVSVANPHKLWPPGGVYAVTVEGEGAVWQGMMNVGRAPTVKNLAEDRREIEVHLFDFDGDLYTQTVRVYCHYFLREERRFPSVDALTEQLRKDRERTLGLLGDGRGSGA